MKRARTRPGPPRGPKPSTVTAPPAPSAARPQLPKWEAKPPPPKRGAPLPKLALRAQKTVSPKRQVGRIIDDDEASLIDLIDNLLNKGVMLNADLILALADVDLIYIRLSALLCGADRVLAPLRPDSTPTSPRLRRASKATSGRQGHGGRPPARR